MIPACQAVRVGAFLLLAFAARVDAIELNCGSLRASFGPFDYRTVSTANRELVEGAHFQPKVEMLQQGTTGPVGGDIAYTLRAMPNNPRALLAMDRLGQRLKTEMPPGSSHTVGCFFERAIRFVPDDPMPHLLYGTYLKNRKRLAEAISEANLAESLRGTPIGYEFDYNLGLLFFDLGNYDKAVAHAKLAYAAGSELPGLKAKLRSVKRWSE